VREVAIDGRKKAENPGKTGKSGKAKDANFFHFFFCGEN
jgi:hypothetical protein